MKFIKQFASGRWVSWLAAGLARIDKLSSFNINGEPLLSPCEVIEAQGKFFILDRSSKSVHVYDQKNCLSRFGRAGKGTGEFENPRGMAFYKDKLYTIDAFSAMVYIFRFAGLLASNPNLSQNLIIGYMAEASKLTNDVVNCFGGIPQLYKGKILTFDQRLQYIMGKQFPDASLEQCQLFQRYECAMANVKPVLATFNELVDLQKRVEIGEP